MSSKTWYCDWFTFTVERGQTIDFTAKIDIYSSTSTSIKLLKNGAEVAHSRSNSEGGADNENNTVLLYRDYVQTTSTFKMCLYDYHSVTIESNRLQWGYQLFGSGHQMAWKHLKMPAIYSFSEKENTKIQETNKIKNINLTSN